MKVLVVYLPGERKIEEKFVPSHYPPCYCLTDLVAGLFCVRFILLCSHFADGNVTFSVAVPTLTVSASFSGYRSLD